MISEVFWREPQEMSTSTYVFQNLLGYSHRPNLVPEIYTKDEINEIFYGVCGAQEKNEGNFQMKLDGVYYPLNDSISWLTTCMEEMRQDITRIQTHRAAEVTTPTLIDKDLTHSNPMKSQPDSYTRAEIDNSSVGFILGFMRRRSLALKTVGLRERDSIEGEARKSEN
ncbi:hypothetical protein Bca101_005991 [Brassica carinata]